MAKIKRSNINISGKIGDLVYAEGKYGRTVRKAPKPGSRKRDIALQMQNTRTKFLNGLAGELNRHFSIYHGRLKSADFYIRLQQCFRKEPIDNRFLLLLRLKGLEINNGYPLVKLGYSKLSIKGMASRINVNLKVEHHPNEGRYHANCYYNELFLLSWDKSKTPATVQQQFSEWIYCDAGKPEFEFAFPKPAGTTHWLLCLRQCLGVNETELPSLKGEGMQIVEVGTFDKKELALWEKQIAEEEKRRQYKSPKKPEVEVVRVKAKKVR